jgi:hypothetical protein
MRRFWKVAGIATLVAVLGVAAVGVVAFAQDGDDGSVFPFNFREKMHDAIAKALGISVEDYDEAIGTAQEEVLSEAVESGWLTQEQADQMRERAEQGFHGGMPGGLHGPRGGKFGRGGLMHGPEGSMLGVAADKLGLTTEELLAKLQDGQSIADVAAEQNVDTQTIVDAYVAQLAERLAEAVENGYLTQERADWMLEQAGSLIPDQLDKTWEDCGPGGFRGGWGPGRFEGFPGQNDA